MDEKNREYARYYMRMHRAKDAIEEIFEVLPENCLGEPDVLAEIKRLDEIVRCADAKLTVLSLAGRR